MKGRFIVIEGIDGSGKSTLARSLSESIGARVESEPTSGPVGAALREGSLGDLPPAAEALLFAADRAVHTRDIAILLESGENVICDRYFASTVAYQSASMGSEHMQWLEGIQTNSVIEPDATILLDIDPESSMARVDSRGEGRSRFEKLDYLRRVRKTYLDLAERHGYSVIDASKDAEEVHQEALKIIFGRESDASE